MPVPTPKKLDRFSRHRRHSAGPWAEKHVRTDRCRNHKTGMRRVARALMLGAVVVLLAALAALAAVAVTRADLNGGDSR